MIKKRYLILILIICLFSISFVNAEEIDNETDVISSDSDYVILESVDDSSGTFDDLQNEINAVEEGGTLNLTRNYKYMNGSTDGINITKAITIDGQGHSIDGNQLSRVFYITANNVVLKNIGFINAKIVNSNGGAIIWEGSNGILYNSSFINCSAKLNKKPYLPGGAIFWSGNGGKISGCIFVNNSISGSYSEGAGAINIQDNGIFYVVNCTFINNSAQYGGAIIANGNVTIVDSSFFNNSASTAGGAIDSRGSVIVLNSSFFNNSAGYASGAIDSRGNLTVVDSSFINNSADRGGAIYIWDDVMLNVNNCSFFNNSATDFSGAIYGEGSIILLNSRFTNNSAYSGGAIRTENDATIYNCSFIGNCAGDNGEIYASGGAIYVSFYHNLYEYVEDFNLFNCTFIDNHAEDSGGAINAIFTDKYGIGEHDEYFNLFNCSFINNSAVKAGAINIDQSSYSRNIFHGNITNCSFTSNIANGSAGAIYAYNTKNLNIFNSTFCENNANVDGAAISYNSTLNNTISDCLFINNSMGGLHTIGWFESSGIVNNSYFMPEMGVFSNYSGVTIFKKKTILESSNISFEYKDNATFSAILKNDNGIIKNNEIIIDITNGEYSERFYSITNASGVASLNDELCLLNAGVWNVSVIYEGNDNYYSCDTISTITVLPLNTSLIILDANTTVNHEIYIIATVISDFTVNEGNVTFFDDDNQIAVSQVTNGNATLIYTPTTAGEHKITAVFDSVNYLNSTGFASLFVDSAKVDILVENGTVGFNSTFVAEVKGLYSTINEGNVKFYVNKEYLGKVPVVNGSASIVYVPLVAGDYSVRVVYCDSDRFLDDEDSVEYNVFEADSNIIVGAVNGTVGHEIVINVTVSSSNNLTVNEGSVVFFDGVNQIGESQVINGTAILSYTPLSDGEHTVTAVFNSDNYLSSNNTVTFYFIDDGTFTALQAKIDNAPEGSTITLEKDYTYNSGFSTEGIIINKPITIDGQGHTIDGIGESKIFLIESDSNFNNVLFINGFSSKNYVSPIYINAGDVNFNNCSFINNINRRGSGGAIGANSKVNFNDCNFIKNSANSSVGGAVMMEHSSCGIFYNCTFVNNTCSWRGHAIFIGTDTNNVHILNSSFINNCIDYGSTILVSYSENITISYCNFVKPEEFSDSAINFEASEAIVEYCDFNPMWNNIYIDGGSDIKITKKSSNLNITSTEFSYGNCTIFSSRLFGVNNNSIINKSINFKFVKDNVILEFNKTTNVNGIASIYSELFDLDVGIWDVNVIFNGGDSFNSCNSTSTITVLPLSTSLIIADTNGTVGHEINLIANVSSNNLTIDEGFVSFYINSEFIGDASVMDGVASLTYEILEYGDEYTITAIYNGNNYLSSNGTARLFVNPGNVNVSKYSSFGTFKALSKLIENTPEGDVLTLTKDYIYVSGSTGGISINKPITIDGQGHTIDGNYLSKIFNIDSGPVILKNLTIINSKSNNEHGSAVYWNSDNGCIVNCKFINCSSNRGSGGAIHWVGSNGVINDSIFENCSSRKFGGAIYFFSKDGRILNSIFKNNSVINPIQGYQTGGALVCDKDGICLDNCSFYNNSVSGLYVDTIYWRGADGIINNTYFYPEYNSISDIDAIDLSIIKRNSLIFCENISFEYKNPLNYTISLNHNNKILINISNSYYYKQFNKNATQGIVTLYDELNDLNVGIWNVTVIFEGNDNYYPYSTTATITVLPTSSSLTISDVNTTVGHEINLMANVRSDLTINEGNVVFYDDGNQIGVSQVRDGVATLTYVPATDGEHTITAIFDSVNYLSSNSTAKLLVDSATIDLLVENGTVGFNSTFIAEVKGLYSTINEGNVKFYVNNKYLGVVPVVNGSASIVYVPLVSGDYTVTAIYCDSDKFLDDDDSIAYHVFEADSNIVVAPVNGTVGHEIIINVTVSSSNNLTVNEGSVVFFDGETEIGESQIRNGKATLTYVPTTDGEHTITAIFNSDNYLSSNSTAKLLVDSATVNLLVENSTVGFNSTFVAEVKGLYSTVNEGNVKFYVNNKYLGVVPVVNGSASINYMPLIAGDYTVTAIYCDSSKFLDDEDSVDYHVFEADSNLVVVPVNGTVGHEIVINVVVSSSNNLTVNEGSVVFFDGETEIGESQVKNGKATLTYVPMTAGDHTITAIFDSDNYLNSTNTSILSVEKASIDLNINEIRTVFFSNPSEFNVNVKSNSKEVNEGNIKYYVNNILIGSSFVNNGKTNYDYVLNESGTFNLLVCFDETDNYLSSNTSTTFSVVRMPTTLSGNSIIFDENDTKTYTTVLTDSNKNGVSNQSVQILVIKYSGEYSEFYAITDSNGVSIYDINSLNGGMWYVTGAFDGDENYIESSFEDKFIIIKIETTTTIEEINNPRVNHTYKLKANIHDENGKLVKEGIVQFYLDGVDIGSIDLSKNQGHQNGLLGASNPMDYILGADEDDSDLYIEYTPSKAGNYTLSAVYEGTTLYKSSYETTTLVVKEEDSFILSAPDVVKYYHGPERFVVTLKENNIPIPYENVKITIRGVTYTRITDSEGQCSMSLNLNSGVYNITVEYNGSEVVSTVTILPTIYAEDIVKVYGNDTQFYATFTDSKGIILPKGTVVTFNYNGFMYSREIIDNKGTAMLEINDAPETYILTSSNPVTGEYLSNTVVVLPNIVENYDLTKYYNESERFGVRVIAPNGEYASGQKVKFTIGNSSYESISNSNGYAFLDTVLQPGEYVVKTSFGGNNVTNIIKILPTLSNGDIKVSSIDIKEGENEIIKVVLPNDATGKVSTIINNKEYSANVNNGVGNIIIPNLKCNSYNIEVIYSGDSQYNSVKGYTSFIVEKTFILIAPDVTKYFHGPEKFVVSLVNNNNPVVNAQVKITINGVTYTKTTNSNGQYALGLNLNSGIYNVTTEYRDTKVYSTVTIKDTVIANDFSKMFRNGTQYSGTFVDSQGNILKGANIDININGIHYYRITDENGVAGLNINLPPGTYVLTAYNPASGEQHTTTVTVLPTIVENHDLIKYYKNSTQYTIRLLGPDGKPVGSGERVTFNINGIFYTRTSDASGYATLDINLPPGTYIITADYNGLKASNTITVKSVLFANDLYMKYKDGSQFTAKVLDGQGKPLAGATVRFNINGVFYNRVTGEDGIARLDINLLMGNYVITSSYNGLNAANNVIIGNNPMYYTIGSNPLDYNYYMNEYNKFSLDWYYVDQYASNVKTIYDIYGNSGMELQTVRYGTQYICYEPSTGKEVALNGAGEVISWSINRDYTEDYILYDEFNNELARGRWINGEGIGQYYS